MEPTSPQYQLAHLLQNKTAYWDSNTRRHPVRVKTAAVEPLSYAPIAWKTDQVACLYICPALFIMHFLHFLRWTVRTLRHCKSVTISARLVLVAAALQGQFSGNFSLWHPVLPAVLKPSLARRTNFRQSSSVFFRTLVTGKRSLFKTSSLQDCQQCRLSGPTRKALEMQADKIIKNIFVSGPHLSTRGARRRRQTGVCTK